MMNKHAVIWTRVNGSPQKMGDLVLTGGRCDFTYEASYSGPGLGLLGDRTQWGADSVTYPVSERVPVMPMLLNHIPGRNPRNLQRSVFLNLIRRELGHEPRPGIDTEWRMLQLGGHGGIGHLDVFRNDLLANEWYRSERKRRAQTGLAENSSLWRLARRDLRDMAVEVDSEALAALGPMPSVAGMMPKLLVSMEAGKNTFFPPDQPQKRNRILKIETPEYGGVMDLEALCLQVHSQAGLETPGFQRLEFDGVPMLAVDRFDRTEKGTPIPMESLFSILAMGDHRFRETADTQLEEIGQRLNRLRGLVHLPKNTEEKIYQRILMALVTGNGDLHLNNLSFLGDVNNCRLSPVYDPAPMRAWPRHNLVSAIPFDPTHAKPFINIGRSFGLPGKRIREMIAQALDTTRDYPAQVSALHRVPPERREQLIAIVKKERRRLEAELSRSAAVLAQNNPPDRADTQAEDYASAKVFKQ